MTRFSNALPAQNGSTSYLTLPIMSRVTESLISRYSYQTAQPSTGKRLARETNSTQRRTG
ncbi:hypothetical protein FOQG_18943 [Fusarium oxysporum f. sp. raphani 54005]|uniref:Uncharacterized protein n=1 Tax=Fusarium oxysporum f. sp. raphani 54005 TaxID=1089458 RepID=X0C0I2_FUSOX|nr:hypothetical protein FOQG_18943 [Fusarium oxysporum f. sp. raphani 54005]